MKCEFDDDCIVDYSGSLRVTKGDDINLFLKKKTVPGGVQSVFQASVRENDCDKLRKAASELVPLLKNHPD